MQLPTPIVIWTIIGPMALGMMCLVMMRKVEQLMDFADSMYSVSRTVMTDARMMRA